MTELKEYKTCISAANLADTGFSYTLSLISGKYKMTILYIRWVSGSKATLWERAAGTSATSWTSGPTTPM